MSAVTCNGSVMTVYSSCPQLAIQVAKGREYTQKRVIPPTWYTDLCPIPKDFSRESNVIKIHVLDSAKFNQALMIIYLALNILVTQLALQLSADAGLGC